MLRESLIPPQPGVPFRVNHKFPPLEKMNLKIADGNLSFKAPPKSDRKRRLLLNNFDASVRLKILEIILKWEETMLITTREALLAWL